MIVYPSTHIDDVVVIPNLFCEQKEESKPRLLKLCEAYKLTQPESDLLHLAVIMQGSNNSQVLNSLVELDYMRKVRFASISFANPMSHPFSEHVDLQISTACWHV